MAILPSAVASTGPAITVRAGSVRGELIQQAIARSTTHDSNFLEVYAGNLFEGFERGAVFEREAFENRAGKRGRDCRARAGECLAQKSEIAAGHVVGIQESGVIRIDKGSESVSIVGRCGEQIVIGEISFPRAPARLEQPQSGDVLQHAHRPANAAFVGEIQVDVPSE